MWWEDFHSNWCYECTMDHTWPSCKAGSTNRSLSRAGGADSFWRCHEDLHLQRALQACRGSRNPADHCPSISWAGLYKKTQPAPCPASAWLAARAGCKSRFFRKSFQVETTFGLQSRCLRVLGNAFICISGTLHRTIYFGGMASRRERNLNGRSNKSRRFTVHEFFFGGRAFGGRVADFGI